MYDLVIIGIIAATATLIAVLSYLTNKKQRLLRQLKKIAQTDILQFKTNVPTKITGKVLHVHEPFVAPFSKRKCVAYEFKIQQKKSSRKHQYWKTLVENADIQDFFVSQGGELAMVKPIKDPKNYISYLVADKNVTSGMFKPPEPEFKALLERYNIVSETFLVLTKPCATPNAF